MCTLWQVRNEETKLHFLRKSMRPAVRPRTYPDWLRVRLCRRSESCAGCALRRRRLAVVRFDFGCCVAAESSPRCRCHQTSKQPGRPSLVRFVTRFQNRVRLLSMLRRLGSSFLFAILSLLVSPVDSRAATKPNIILITLGSTRTDRMGFLGARGSLTPSL